MLTKNILAAVGLAGALLLGVAGSAEARGRGGGGFHGGPVSHGPVYGGGFHRGPVYGGGFYRRPVYGGPVYNTPVYSPAYSTPVYGPAYGAPVYAPPVYRSPVWMRMHRPFVHRY